MFTIRDGIKSDCKDIHDMLVELSVHEKVPNYLKVGQKELEECGYCEPPERRIFWTYVVELNDTKELIGYALYYYKFTWIGKVVWIGDLYIKQEYRSLGVGKAMMSALAKHAYEHSFDKIEWRTSEWNQNAIKFYQNLGAVNVTDPNNMQNFRLNKLDIEKLAKL